MACAGLGSKPLPRYFDFLIIFSKFLKDNTRKVKYLWNEVELEGTISKIYQPLSNSFLLCLYFGNIDMTWGFIIIFYRSWKLDFTAQQTIWPWYFADFLLSQGFKTWPAKSTLNHESTSLPPFINQVTLERDLCCYTRCQFQDMKGVVIFPSVNH